MLFATLILGFVSEAAAAEAPSHLGEGFEVFGIFGFFKQTFVVVNVQDHGLRLAVDGDELRLAFVCAFHDEVIIPLTIP